MHAGDFVRQYQTLEQTRHELVELYRRLDRLPPLDPALASYKPAFVPKSTIFPLDGLSLEQWHARDTKRRRAGNGDDYDDEFMAEYASNNSTVGNMISTAASVVATAGAVAGLATLAKNLYDKPMVKQAFGFVGDGVHAVVSAETVHKSSVELERKIKAIALSLRISIPSDQSADGNSAAILKTQLQLLDQITEVVEKARKDREMEEARAAQKLRAAEAKNAEDKAKFDGICSEMVAFIKELVPRVGLPPGGISCNDVKAKIVEARSILSVNAEAHAKHVAGRWWTVKLGELAKPEMVTNLDVEAELGKTISEMVAENYVSKTKYSEDTDKLTAELVDYKEYMGSAQEVSHKLYSLLGEFNAVDNAGQLVPVSSQIKLLEVTGLLIPRLRNHIKDVSEARQHIGSLKLLLNRGYLLHQQIASTVGDTITASIGAILSQVQQDHREKEETAGQVKAAGFAAYKFPHDVFPQFANLSILEIFNSEIATRELVKKDDKDANPTLAGEIKTLAAHLTKAKELINAVYPSVDTGTSLYISSHIDILASRYDAKTANILDVVPSDNLWDHGKLKDFNNMSLLEIFTKKHTEWGYVHKELAVGEIDAQSARFLQAYRELDAQCLAVCRLIHTHLRETRWKLGLFKDSPPDDVSATVYLTFLSREIRVADGKAMEYNNSLNNDFAKYTPAMNTWTEGMFVEYNEWDIDKIEDNILENNDSEEKEKCLRDMNLLVQHASSAMASIYQKAVQLFSNQHVAEGVNRVHDYYLGKFSNDPQILGLFHEYSTLILSAVSADAKFIEFDKFHTELFEHYHKNHRVNFLAVHQSFSDPKLIS